MERSGIRGRAVSVPGFRRKAAASGYLLAGVDTMKEVLLSLLSWKRKLIS